jgi:hypothetical protein
VEATEEVLELHDSFSLMGLRGGMGGAAADSPAGSVAGREEEEGGLVMADEA